MDQNPQTTSLANGESWHIPALISVAFALLVTGLCLPVMRVQQLLLWRDEYTVFHGIAELFNEGSYFLAVILFSFSICFPICKLLALLYVWFKPLTRPQQESALEWLQNLGKWSMLDVFVVALLIVISKTGAGLNIQPRIGLYFFAAAVFASSLLTSKVSKRLKGHSHNKMT